VRAHKSTIAVFDQGTGELTTGRVAGRPHDLPEQLMQIAVPARMVYEAGPTGYGLVRRARALGIEMVVCAPGTHRSGAERSDQD
jgi:transposase